MFQRVQTIYLLIAFVLMILLLFFPVFSIEINTADGDITQLAYLNSHGIVDEDGVLLAPIPISYIYIGLAMLTALCILMFKKRKRQLLLTRLNLIMHLLVIVGIYGIYYFGEPLVMKGIEQELDLPVSVGFYMEIGFFFLIPTLAFIYLAIRGIKRDENLVNSLDRLR